MAMNIEITPMHITVTDPASGETLVYARDREAQDPIIGFMLKMVMQDSYIFRNSVDEFGWEAVSKLMDDYGIPMAYRK